MAAVLFNSEDIPFAEKLSRLTWVNPFTQERKTIIDGILGEATAAAPGSEDVGKLLEVVTEFLEKFRKPFATRKRASVKERRLYQDIAFLLIYYRMIEEFDRVIESAHTRGGAGQRITFYDKFCEEVAYWLPDGLIGEYQDFEYSRLFSVFFQVRRAYYHINRYIFGGSPAAIKLRAGVWQSVFTHNMQRYQRVLADQLNDVITLITGPSGSGKELVARGVGLSRFIPFDTSARVFEEDFLRTFFPINLSALSPTLIESELFGHRKGAFTGALQDRKGYLEMCGQYGSVFLDEIGEIEPTIQVKLLRLLQTRVFQRIGESEPRVFKGKIMAATNRDLVLEIQEGRFREDFYFRLIADRIRTPSLREILSESPSELERLVGFIAKKIAGDKEGKLITDEACTWIKERMDPYYAWPGNFRELEQCVRNIVVHGEYFPDDFQKAGTGADRLIQGIQSESLTADELLILYTKRLYDRIRNYEEVGRRMGLDRRTVKKYVQDEAE